jgi:hypothetical protein
MNAFSAGRVVRSSPCVLHVLGARRLAQVADFVDGWVAVFVIDLVCWPSAIDERENDAMR